MSAAAPAPPGELDASLDNGAEGRDHFGRPEHVPPGRACPDTLGPNEGSLLVRLLPDGPRRADGSLAFTAGVCVYLPPGYAASDLEYPVLYLLHGGGGDAADFVTFGALRQAMDDLAAAGRPALVVMPDGTDGQWYDAEDGSVRNETYVLGHLLDWADGRFRTIAARRGRAVAGISNGGFGAMLFAAKAPGRFGAAGSMSGNLGAMGITGLGPRWGDWFAANRPANLVGRLGDVDLVLDIATTCTSTDPADHCEALRMDRRFLAANRDFVERVRAARGGGGAELDYRETEGSHDWRWWRQWLHERQLPWLLDRLQRARPRRG